MPETSGESKRLADEELEYIDAAVSLKNFCRLLAEDELIVRAETQVGSFEEYLKVVATRINELLPFINVGIGVSEISKQTNVLTYELTHVKSFSELKTSLSPISEPHDCKLPAAAMAFFIRDLIEKKRWPLRCECILIPGNTHAIIGVHVEENTQSLGAPMPKKGEYNFFSIDFEVFDAQKHSAKVTQANNYSVARVNHFHDRLPPHLQAQVETNLYMGLKMFDKAYFDALKASRAGSTLPPQIPTSADE